MSYEIINIENGYGDVTPTLIPNTTMRARLNDDNSVKTFRITPIAGYVLHDKAGDWYEEYDEEGNGIGEAQRSYTRGTLSCGANYDFTTLTVQIRDNDGNALNVTAYGAQKEFFAIPDTTAPENNIFNVPSNTETA